LLALEGWLAEPDERTEMTTAAPPRLSDEQLTELLALLHAADSVELKLTLPESVQRSAVDALGMDPLNAQIRQVFFFDTVDLALDRAGVVVRARRVQGKGDGSVVKLRPVVPETLPVALRRSPAFVAEVDAMPGGYVCSGSLKHVPEGVREAVAGKRSIRKLFSEEQRAFFARHAPDGLGLEDLSVLGPIFVLKLKLSPEGLGRKLVAEMWLYPDGSRIVELSTKCPPQEMFMVAAECLSFLSEHGIERSGEQATKTRHALEYFSAAAASTPPEPI
jgi:hypothetical protein